MSSATQVQKDAVSEAMTRFGVKLYRRLVKEHGQENVVFSPASIVTALSMVLLGAKSYTARGLISTIGLAIDVRDLPKLGTAFGEWIKDYNGSSKADTKLANSLWVDESYGDRIGDDYAAMLMESFEATGGLLDFTNHPDAAASAINAWVNEHTNGMIPSIADGKALADADLVISNAVYFKSEWHKKFKKSGTADAEFRGLTTVSKIPFMNQVDKFSYYQGDDFKSLIMNYKSNFKLLTILPDDITAFEAKFNRGTLGNIISRSEWDTFEVTVSYPKFEAEFGTSLAKHLVKMGADLAFSEQADLSGMTPPNRLFKMTDVLHKARIEVDEEGSKAAAVTAVLVGAMAASAPPEPVEFIANKPFIYAILDNNGSVIFLGRYVNPK